MAVLSLDKVAVDRANKTLALPYNVGLANLIAGHKVKGDKLIVPHTHDVVRLARNMGMRAPAPIMVRYDWNGDTPFKTQKITAAMLTMNKRAYVLSEMGTGKTRGTLFAIDFLIKEREIRKALVIAPLSTLSAVWDSEVFRYFNHLSVGVLHGSRERRKEVLAQDHDIYVINHDGVKTILPDLLARDDIDCVVVDELAAFRNATTDRWKHLASLVSGRLYVWGLTGSPTPNEPADAWAQAKLLTPERVPKYRKRFKEATMVQVSTFRWMPRKNANDIVYEAMQPAVRFTRDDCIELPDTIYHFREAPLSKQQKDAHDEIIRVAKLEFQQGTVTAANEGVLFSKLLQIGSGYVYTKDRAVVTLDNSSRLDALEELLNEADGKVIVFNEFIHVAEAVFAELTKRGFDCAKVTGQTSKTARDQIFKEFQTAMSPRILVAHPKCMSHGLTLTAANVIVWFTPTTSLDTYEQACARITRPGQKRKQLIVHLTGTAIESKLYKRLQQKSSLQGALLEMFE